MNAETLLRRLRDLLLFANFLAAGQRVILDELVRTLSSELPAGEWYRRDRERRIAALVKRWDRASTVSFDRLTTMTNAQLADLSGAYRQQAGRDVGRSTKSTAPPGQLDVFGAPIDRWQERNRVNMLHAAEMAVRRVAARGGTTAEMADAIVAAVRRPMAQTEALAKAAVHRASGVGYAAGLADAGVERFRWVAVMDERTCHRDVYDPSGSGVFPLGCFEANGNVFTMTDPRIISVPPAHGSCRCRMVPVGAGEAVPGDAGSLTSEEWAALFRAEADRRLAAMTDAERAAVTGRSARMMTLDQLRGGL